MRYLTKSRFKLAVECPRKLYYTGKTSEYLDRSRDDSFLAALAEGGYQVGALAQLMHPAGVFVDEKNHELALARTDELLRRDTVTIFEAALAAGPLFIRVDILRKMGPVIELIEVKAKSYSVQADGDFRGSRGQIKSEFLPYLRDVAFQKHVAAVALPGHAIHAFLMLANKEAVSTVDGLNQLFKVKTKDGPQGRQLTVLTPAGLTLDALGASLLAKVQVNSQVDEILAGSLPVAPHTELPFAEAVAVYAQAYADDTTLAPIPSGACARCQFKAERWPAPGELRSGFHECWSTAFGWGERDFEGDTVLDLWNCRKKDKFIEEGKRKLSSIGLHDLDFDGDPPAADGMTPKHRQWYTCKRDWPGAGEFFIDRQGLLRASSAWTYPLHCIDFETSAVAIPFVRGRRPYQTTAFQFSHHVIEQDGQISHRSQWICTQPGMDPNVDFVRALRAALSNDGGTIFRWAAHENTVLNQLRAQMLAATDPPEDVDALVDFIESITTRKGEKADITGPRSMVDLCRLAEKFYFHPATKGSSSLKKVLPALMASSSYLRERYGQAWYGPGVSLNFTQPMAWWQMQNGAVTDPYKLLPPVFDDVAAEDLDAFEDQLSEELREGGAAMSAYARLQFEDMPDAQRKAIRQALLRYCELDTLAMVMAVQAWGVVPLG